MSTSNMPFLEREQGGVGTGGVSQQQQLPQPPLSTPTNQSTHAPLPLDQKVTVTQGQAPTATITTQQQPSQQQQVHKRTYQACQPCRERKVKCDLGSVEAPHDPPCARCLREGKKCVFSATRRKRADSKEIPHTLRRAQGVDPDEDPDSLFPVSNVSRKRRRTLGDSDESPKLQNINTGGHPHGQDMIPHASIQTVDMYLRHPHTQIAPDHTQLVEVEIPIQQHPPLLSPQMEQLSIFKKPLYHSNAAMNLLVKAANHHEDEDDVKLESESFGGSSRSATITPQVSPTQHTAQLAIGTQASSNNSSHTTRRSQNQVSPRTLTEEEMKQRALRDWSKFRPVLRGWLSAQDAMTFMSYFAEHIHPLSPILTSPLADYISDYQQHRYLLRDEPFLAMVILCVATRYISDSRIGGAYHRSFAIHELLWRETRKKMLHPMLDGGGSPSLRSLGTLEALIILSEWHVRGLSRSVDPEDHDYSISLSDDEDKPNCCTPDPPRIVRGLNDKIGNILQPADRSDRMSWHILGNALALASELGVFDTDPPEHLAARLLRIQRTLQVHTTQLASRLGRTSMIPKPLTVPTTPIPPLVDPKNLDALHDTFYLSWSKITKIMTDSSAALFASPATTQDLTRSSQYIELLNRFNPLLDFWHEEFLTLNLPSGLHQILLLEYEHVRFYINSVSLQACINRAITGIGVGSIDPSAIPPDDVKFITMMVNSCRTLLQCVNEEMHPRQWLKHAPVRVSLRILSAAMFLLKSFAVGAGSAEIGKSLMMIRNATNALKEGGADGVHLANVFADMLGILAKSVEDSLVGTAEGEQGEVQMMNAGLHISQDQTMTANNQHNTFTSHSHSHPWLPHQPLLNTGINPQVTLASGTAGTLTSSASLSSAAGGGLIQDNLWDWDAHAGDWTHLPFDNLLEMNGEVQRGNIGANFGEVDLLEAMLGVPM
ncbi:hypothetical protein BZA77DRAFT_65740 [Pyronema omphalodes]|nr:hypothetical protein BZA77DRAFT_65740 [Pyronema omphalodes]